MTSSYAFRPQDTASQVGSLSARQVQADSVDLPSAFQSKIKSYNQNIPWLAHGGSKYASATAAYAARYSPGDMLTKSRMVAPGVAYTRNIARAPCLQEQNMSHPLNSNFSSSPNKARINIDGKKVQSDMCTFACNTDPNSQQITVPGRAQNTYVLPGGVKTALREFVSCQ